MSQPVLKKHCGTTQSISDRKNEQNELRKFQLGNTKCYTQQEYLLLMKATLTNKIPGISYSPLINGNDESYRGFNLNGYNGLITYLHNVINKITYMGITVYFVNGEIEKLIETFRLFENIEEPKIINEFLITRTIIFKKVGKSFNIDNVLLTVDKNDKFTLTKNKEFVMENADLINKSIHSLSHYYPHIFAILTTFNVII